MPFSDEQFKRLKTFLNSDRTFAVAMPKNGDEVQFSATEYPRRLAIITTAISQCAQRPPDVDKVTRNLLRLSQYLETCAQADTFGQLDHTTREEMGKLHELFAGTTRVITGELHHVNGEFPMGEEILRNFHIFVRAVEAGMGISGPHVAH